MAAFVQDRFDDPAVGEGGVARQPRRRRGAGRGSASRPPPLRRCRAARPVSRPPPAVWSRTPAACARRGSSHAGCRAAACRRWRHGPENRGRASHPPSPARPEPAPGRPPKSTGKHGDRSNDRVRARARSPASPALSASTACPTGRSTEGRWRPTASPQTTAQQSTLKDNDDPCVFDGREPPQVLTTTSPSPSSKAENASKPKFKPIPPCGELNHPENDETENYVYAIALHTPPK